MNAENFTEVINDPSRLFQFSYEELRSLVLEHPFSTNLRYLLLIKSKLEKHPEYKRNLKMASTYSPDRSFLYHYMENLEDWVLQKPQAIEMEDFLELKDLQSIRSNIEEDLDALESVEQKTTVAASVAQEIEPPIDSIEEETKATPLTEELPIEDTTIPQSEDQVEFETSIAERSIDDIIQGTVASIQSSSPKVDAYVPEIIPPAPSVSSTPLSEEEEEEISTPDFNGLSEQLDAEISKLLDESDLNTKELEQLATNVPFIPETEYKKEEKKIEEIQMDTLNEDETQKETDLEPLPQQEFRSWKQRYKRRVFSWEVNRTSTTETTPAPSSKSAAKMAAQSLSFDDQIASETLAKLLEQQGHLERAKKMYTQLSLLFPEKNAFFAAKIKEIDSKLS